MTWMRHSTFSTFESCRHSVDFKDLQHRILNSTFQSNPQPEAPVVTQERRESLSPWPVSPVGGGGGEVGAEPQAARCSRRSARVSWVDRARAHRGS